MLDDADFCQPLSTILQVALANFSRKIRRSSCCCCRAFLWGNRSRVGPLILFSSKVRLRFRRLRACLEARLLSRASIRRAGPKFGSKGCIISADVSENRVRDIIASLNFQANPKAVGLSVACINSPSNVTVSGEETLIEKLKAHLDGQKLFSHKLRTPLAYITRRGCKLYRTGMIPWLASFLSRATRKPLLGTHLCSQASLGSGWKHRNSLISGTGPRVRGGLCHVRPAPFHHLGRNYRLQSVRACQFLGARSRDWNFSDARWQYYMRRPGMAWAKHYVINGTTLYPGTGMLAMAVEATKQLAIETSERTLHGYTI
ncbi:hypothetical protein CP532_5120 [Ophiocordyceps camponoti-leonardi (nom. inval.)]|nr:hypothetical protein CP532_5120 [Ophiocordyceps camponoti-leonardi (nom. inval.)]